jgi:hypothetical protein
MGTLSISPILTQDTQYTIARLKTSNQAAGIIVVGHLAGVSPGETLNSQRFLANPSQIWPTIQNSII